MADEELDVMNCPYMIKNKKIIFEHDDSGMVEFSSDAAKKEYIDYMNGSYYSPKYIREHHAVPLSNLKYHIIEEPKRICTYGRSDKRKRYLATECVRSGKCPISVYTKENYNDECKEYNNKIIESYNALIRNGCAGCVTARLREYAPNYAAGGIDSHDLYFGDRHTAIYDCDDNPIRESYLTHYYDYPDNRSNQNYNCDSLWVVMSKDKPCRYEIVCLKVLEAYCKWGYNYKFIPYKVPKPNIENCLQGICMLEDEEHTCPACGSVFTGAGWCSQKDGQLYCSKECMQQGAKPKIEPTKEKRDELTQDIKNQVLNRDGHKCILCGSTENLHVHHLIPLYAGGNNSLTNLTTVCSKCHMKIHNNGGDYSVGNDDTEQKRLS